MNRYVIIEDFNGYISLCTNEEGEVMVFPSLEEAEKEANECQNGKIIKL